MSQATPGEPEPLDVPPGRLQSPVRDAAYLVGGQVLASLLLIATGIVLARGLGPAGKGYYDIAVGSAMLLSTFTGLSLSSGVFFYASKGPLAHRRLLLILATIALGQGGFVAAVLAGLADTRVVSWILPDGSGVRTALLVGFLLGAIQSQQLIHGLAKGRGKFKASAVSEVLARGGTLTLILALAAIGTARPEAYVIAYAVTTVIAVLVLAVVVAAPPDSTTALPLRAMLLYSLPLFVGNVVQFLNYRLDIFFLKNFVGLGAVGRYTLAVWFAQILWLIPNALASLVLRTVAERQGDTRAIDQMTAVTRATMGLSVVTGLALAAIGVVSIVPVFGREFHGSIPALLFLMPGAILFGPTIILSAYLNGIRRQVWTTWIACGALVVTVVLNLLLVPPMGIDGSAIASTCSYTASTFATAYVVRRLNPGLAWRVLLLPRRSDLRFALDVVGSGLARVRGIAWNAKGTKPTS